MTKKKICIVATVPFAIIVFMREHIAKLSQFYEITLISSGDESELIGVLNDRVKFISVNIERRVSILSDILAFYSLVRVFYVQRFDCVHSLMPKSALLAMLAARLVNTPRRVHIFTGQVWSTKTGLAKLALKWLDRLLSACATHLLADSPSQRDFLIAEKIAKPGKIEVLGEGSISGVDINRFKMNEVERLNIRKKFGIAENEVAFLYLARLTRAKGIVDLVEAFVGIASTMPDAHLIVIGPDEEGLLSKLQESWSAFKDRIHRLEYTHQPENYMSAADVFCLPSYREGFSLATIQAAGVGLPAIVSRIYGLTDAVQSGVTGIFHEAGKIAQIQAALKLLYADTNLRKKMGEAAQRRAYENFSQDLVVEEMRLFYERILAPRSAIK
ncbi:glycosyltransferase [Polaromonas naphthalenivorans]|uniref:Glycosyl transferase, group 1 n=1 Tax=Polaromonas naphthalenivorans (strain CJ2) TaxID=365044 RepID=A1VT02_POLNA|nr:glycosyltransferase [Polaromonas naphthalenivorans]ABM38780.1 glycosyl transferase, group 1 [Polaromonas naphthalenivorans CJ2]